MKPLLASVVQGWMSTSKSHLKSDFLDLITNEEQPSIEETSNFIYELAVKLSNSTDIITGIGPAKSKRIKIADPSITFIITKNTDPQSFYEMNLLREDEDGDLFIITNLHQWYIVRNSIPAENGHFDVSHFVSKDRKKSIQTIENHLATVIQAALTSIPKNMRTKRDKRLELILRSVQKEHNEEEVKKNFVFPLCRISGWHVDPDDDNDPLTSVEVEKYQPARGRLDLLLKDNGIPRIVIECKKPGVILVKDNMITDDGKRAMEQVHKYATGVRFWRNKQLPNVMSLIINGRHAIWFDSTVSESELIYKSAKHIEISESTINELFTCLKLSNVRESDLGFICATKTIFDERVAIQSSSTHALTVIATKWLGEIQKKIKKEEALAMTLQVLFLTIARDHGILGADEIENKLGTGDWDGLFKKCKKRFNSNVFEMERPKALTAAILNEIYDESRRLSFTLQAIPVDYIGDVYESLLHHLHKGEEHLSKTSYYTPQWLIKEVIDNLNPSYEEKIIDPTCGSSAFLCSAFEKVNRDRTFEEAKWYLSNNVYGVDRDALAVQVSRFALLVELARKVPGEWKDREHILPSLSEHIVCRNFFLYESKTKFDIAVGNPPWGSIDHEVQDADIKNSLKKFDSYCDKTDICVYIVEKAFKQLSQTGRMGFLVQRSTIDGIKHKNFRTWWNGRLSEVWDFGKDELFAPRNAALTAVLIGSVESKSAKPKTVDRSLTNSCKSLLKVTGTKFSEHFHCLKGAESGKNEVYDLYAAAFPKDKMVRSIVSPEMIQYGTISKQKKSLFIHPNILDSEVKQSIKSWFKKTMVEGKVRKEKKSKLRTAEWWLKNRAEIKRKKKKSRSSLAWLWLNSSKNYSFDENQYRIVFPYYLNNDRLCAGIDLDGSMVPLTSTTVLIPKKGTTEDLTWFTLGWLNSKVFASTEAQKSKMAAKGGRALYQNYVSEMLIPEVSEYCFDKVATLMKQTVEKGKPLDEHQLRNLDSIFEGELSKSITNKKGA